MKFSEPEVGSLIQRASELHKNSLNNSEHDLTLSEVEAIAKELGIPSRFLVEAALERNQSKTKSSSGLWGAPFEVIETRVTDAPITDKEWDEALSEIQEFFGKKGRIEKIGSTKHWVHTVGEGESGFNFEQVRVSLKDIEGKTSIQLKHEYKGAIPMYFMAFGAASFLTLMVAHSVPDVSKLTELLYAAMGGVTALGGVRAAISISARRFKDRLGELANRLSHGSGTESIAEQLPEAERAPRLDLNDLEQDTEVVTEASRKKVSS